jgi:hypothetical protein
MYSVAICIPVVEEINLVSIGLHQITKHSHPEIETHVYVVDQSGGKEIEKICQKYRKRLDVTWVPAKKIDAGYPIDLIARIAFEDFLVSLDADAFPINKNWLFMPIKLMEEFSIRMVGKETGLHMAYKDQGDFFCLNNYFRVMSTGLARRLSLDVGFTRYENRERTGMQFAANTTWNKYCDNGVHAMWYADTVLKTSKLSLSITKAIGRTPEMGIYGMNVDDLVFHLVFGYGKDWIADQNKTLGPEYKNWNELFNTVSESGYDELIEKALASVGFQNGFDLRVFWDGQRQTTLDSEDPINKRIDYLKYA